MAIGGVLGRLGTFASVAAAIALACMAFAAHADDVMRCGSVLAKVGMVASEVVAKCGAPKAKSIEDVPVRVRRPNGAVNTVGTTRIERWTYDRGYGQFPALLTFEQGKLESIELLTGGR